MRAVVLGLCCSVAVLFPKTGKAQVDPARAAEPAVTAAGASWQMRGAPIVVGGLVYYATSGFRFFDSRVMTQVGLFGGVPIYADATLAPGSVVYVPIGRERMREYQRRRDRELAGTTGNRAPAVPGTTLSVEKSAQDEHAIAAIGMIEPPFATTNGPRQAVGTNGDASPDGSFRVVDAPLATTGVVDRGGARPAHIESVPGPIANNGIWLEFDGARWYSAGASASFSVDRFEPVGMYRGFPVYRIKGGSPNEIWVSVVADGPLAPYVRR
jgi:hypothetical protein